MEMDKTRKLVLNIDSVVKRFGGLTAVNNLSLQIYEGQVCALIGPNGSGKTTVLNLITGIYPIDGGRIEFCGNAINGLPAHKICWSGIARTFQNIRILGSQTVLENALLGKGYGNGGAGVFQTIFGTPSHRKESDAFAKEVEDALEFVGLTELRDELAQNLPYGKQRILEIARALVTKPKLLLLDEPAAGLNSAEIYTLMDLIKRINQTGISVLVIEHRMELIKELADWVFVLNYGSKIAEGSFDEIQNNPAVVEAYLGKGRD